ncbi:MAG: recombination factor protein RarA, partial [Litorivicinus sp.]
ALAKEMGHGEGAPNPHGELDGYAAGVHYFPDTLPAAQLYRPVNRGLEIKIGERLARLRARDLSS